MSFATGVIRALAIEKSENADTYSWRLVQGGSQVRKKQPEGRYDRQAVKIRVQTMLRG